MSFLGSALKSIGGALPGIGTAISIGSGILGAVSGSKKGSQADALRKQQLAYANQRVAAGAPFRSKLASLASRPQAQREDLSGLTADVGNPYARSAPRPSLAASAFPQTPQAQPMRPPVSFGEPGMGGGPSDMGQDDRFGGFMRRRPMGGMFR